MSSFTRTPLLWLPPAVNDPVIITLSQEGGRNWWHFADDQDVVFIGDSTHTQSDKLQVEGGHNILVLGGDFQPTTAPVGTLAFEGATGTVFIDGVHIDNAHSSGSDGIDISGGPTTSLVVQNTSIENINGAFSGQQAAGGNGHADAIQVQGNLGGTIQLANLHVTTNYEGLFLSPQGEINPIRGDMVNVDLHYSSFAANDGRDTSYLLWTVDDPTVTTPEPWSFTNVFVQPRDGEQAIDFAVWPTRDMGAVQSGNRITWPDLPYSGAVTVGDHDSFADPALIGLNFEDARALLVAAMNEPADSGWSHA